MLKGAPEDQMKAVDLQTGAPSEGDTRIFAPPKGLFYALLCVLVVYAMVRGIAAAAAKPFWYDEMMTLTVGSQGSWKGIVAAQRQALDSNPPLFYLIENYASKIAGNQEIALRLPSILAFPCTLVCVFVFLRKSAGEMIALLCAGFLLSTELFQYYAVEARPYSMVVACIAFALVCYQRVPSKVWTVLFAVALALAQCLHYYAFLAIAPFGLAELVYSFRAKKIRWSVWAAMAFGCLPLGLFWPLLSALKSYYGAHNWMRVFGVRGAQQVYGEIMRTGWRTGEAIVAVLFVVLAAEWLRKAREEEADGEKRERELVQIVALGGFLLLPFLGFALTHITNSGLVPRYVLCTLLGIAAALGLLLQRAGRLGLILALVVVGFVGLAEVRFWKTWETNLAAVKAYGSARERFIEQKGYGDLPIIVPNGLVVVALAHYADAPFVSRLLFMKQDPEPENPRFTDTIDRELELYQRYAPLKVSTFNEFAGAHNSFLLYLEREHDGEALLDRLSREGWTTRVLESKGYVRLYLVSRGERAAPAAASTSLR